MEDAKKIKIISVVAALALFLGTFALALATISLRKKSSFSRTPGVPTNVSSVSGGQDNASPAGSIDESPKATGFVGLPTGQAKSGTENNLKKFELKGHWSFKETPSFDYAGKDENTKLGIVVNENTKLFKFVAPAEKGQKATKQEISFKDFQIESQNNPYLAIFDEPTGIAFQMILAKEIQIFPLEIK